MRKTVLRALLAALAVLLLISALTACGEPTYTVTFVLGEGRDDVVVETTSTSELYTPESGDDGLVFAGWFTDSELTHPFLGAITADTTLYARFIEKGSFVVTLVYDNGSGDTTLVMQGVLSEPPAPVREGYAFMGWEDASTGLKYEFGKEPTAPHTVLVATWRSAVGGLYFTAYPENGEDPTVYNVAYNSTPDAPDAPTRSGYEFVGWYADEDCLAPYDFTSPLTRDTAIYAGWIRDVASLGNELVSKVLPSSVKIATVHHPDAAEPYKSIGSGVIYSYRSGCYYVLTNAHVVDKDGGLSEKEYTVYDAYGNEYEATLACQPDPEYDLAVLKFSKGYQELGVATLARWDVAVGTRLISVGAPGGVMNSVTYGECRYYKPVSFSGNMIEFDVGWHDTPTANGSSGGAVFDYSLEVVGINFASNTNDDGDFVYGVFIPISRVREYLASCSVL